MTVYNMLPIRPPRYIGSVPPFESVKWSLSSTTSLHDPRNSLNSSSASCSTLSPTTYLEQIKPSFKLCVPSTISTTSLFLDAQKVLGHFKCLDNTTDVQLATQVVSNDQILAAPRIRIVPTTTSLATLATTKAPSYSDVSSFQRSYAPQSTRFTLIVNVPTVTTKSDLIVAFERFGPIELAMVVCDKKNRHPYKEWTATKGIGFVRFAAAEGAQAALTAVASGSIRVRGSKIRAAWAKKDSYHKKEQKCPDERFHAELPIETPMILQARRSLLISREEVDSSQQVKEKVANPFYTSPTVHDRPCVNSLSDDIIQPERESKNREFLTDPLSEDAYTCNHSQEASSPTSPTHSFESLKLPQCPQSPFLDGWMSPTLTETFHELGVSIPPIYHDSELVACKNDQSSLQETLLYTNHIGNENYERLSSPPLSSACHVMQQNIEPAIKNGLSLHPKSSVAFSGDSSIVEPITTEAQTPVDTLLEIIYCQCCHCIPNRLNVGLCGHLICSSCLTDTTTLSCKICRTSIIPFNLIPISEKSIGACATLARVINVLRNYSRAGN